MNVAIGIAVFLVVALFAGFIWQQIEYNMMYKENAKRALKRRVNVATFNGYERQEAREWM